MEELPILFAIAIFVCLYGVAIIIIMVDLAIDDKKKKQKKHKYDN